MPANRNLKEHNLYEKFYIFDIVFHAFTKFCKKIKLYLNKKILSRFLTTVILKTPFN